MLLIGDIKVTDIGMARLASDLNPQATRLTFTMCPGTDVYMPPEAIDDKPVYTEKIDCFSFGASHHYPDTDTACSFQGLEIDDKRSK